jgi:hypothetical protein
MSGPQVTAERSLPCGDGEYREGIKYLQSHCAAFQKYQREESIFALRIGKFRLYSCPSGDIRIDGEGGEGGEFNVAALEEVVEKFYRENL